MVVGSSLDFVGEFYDNVGKLQEPLPEWSLEWMSAGVRIPPAIYITAPSDLQEQPVIRLTGSQWNPTAYWTVFMFDPDAPTPENPSSADWLHWIWHHAHINDKTGLLEGGTHVVPYMGPSPPSYSPPHHYIFLLFEEQTVTEPWVWNEQRDRQNPYQIRKDWIPDSILRQFAYFTASTDKE